MNLIANGQATPQKVIATILGGANPTRLVQFVVQFRGAAASSAPGCRIAHTNRVVPTNSVLMIERTMPIFEKELF